MRIEQGHIKWYWLHKYQHLCSFWTISYMTLQLFPSEDSFDSVSVIFPFRIVQEPRDINFLDIYILHLLSALFRPSLFIIKRSCQLIQLKHFSKHVQNEVEVLSVFRDVNTTIFHREKRGIGQAFSPSSSFQDPKIPSSSFSMCLFSILLFLDYFFHAVCNFFFILISSPLNLIAQDKKCLCSLVQILLIWIKYPHSSTLCPGKLGLTGTIDLLVDIPHPNSSVVEDDLSLKVKANISINKFTFKSYQALSRP